MKKQRAVDGGFASRLAVCVRHARCYFYLFTSKFYFLKNIFYSL
jgi:hypothetical protein